MLIFTSIHFQCGDQQIDSTSKVFSLPDRKGDEFITITATDKSLSLSEFTELIKNH